MITVYTLPVCPNCETLKDILKLNDIQFETRDLEDDDVRMELLMDSVTLVEAPIVKIDDRYMSGREAIEELKLW